MSKKKRANNVFSLSFLDCICCGFGAIILLFVITMGAAERTIEDLKQIYTNIVQQKLLKLNEYDFEIEEKSTLLAMEKTKTSKKEDDENELDKLIAELKQQLLDGEGSADKYLVDLEQTKKEIAAMQSKIDIEQNIIKPSPVGVPVESNHIAFVIDTSGSMRDESTQMIRAFVVMKFDEVLSSYPKVDGIQLLDADGHFILGRSNGNGWLKDTPEVRLHMLRSARLYPRESSSNPVPGIVRAISILAQPQNEEVKMGLYVFGDEFTGKSEPVLRVIDRLNKDKGGNRIAVINAIGFPTMIHMTLGLGQSGLKFANLMRELTHQHGGAFIGLERSAMMDVEREIRRTMPPPPPPVRRPGIILRPY